MQIQTRSFRSAKKPPTRFANLVHPSGEARKGASQGMTVAALKQKDGVALNQAQLHTLLFGKSVWVRNNVTGEVR